MYKKERRTEYITDRQKEKQEDKQNERKGKGKRQKGRIKIERTKERKII